jgi:hypothetical protein
MFGLDELIVMNRRMVGNRLDAYKAHRAMAETRCGNGCDFSTDRANTACPCCGEIVQTPPKDFTINLPREIDD